MKAFVRSSRFESTTTTKQKQKRSVRFQEGELEATVFLIPTKRELSKVHLKSTWYTQKDFKMFKESNHILAEQSFKQGYGLLLKDCFYDDVHPRWILRELTYFSRLSLRGLEESVNPLHADERDELKDRHMFAVLNAQEAMRNAGLKGDDAENVIADTSDDFSFVNREFARLVGMADEAAVSVPRNPRRRSKNKLSGQTTMNGTSSTNHVELVPMAA